MTKLAHINGQRETIMRNDGSQRYFLQLRVEVLCCHERCVVQAGKKKKVTGEIKPIKKGKQ